MNRQDILDELRWIEQQERDVEFRIDELQLELEELGSQHEQLLGMLYELDD